MGMKSRIEARLPVTNRPELHDTEAPIGGDQCWGCAVVKGFYPRSTDHAAESIVEVIFG